jgi:hypothetical protein
MAAGQSPLAPVGLPKHLRQKSLARIHSILPSAAGLPTVCALSSQLQSGCRLDGRHTLTPFDRVNRPQACHPRPNSHVSHETHQQGAPGFCQGPSLQLQRGTYRRRPVPLDGDDTGAGASPLQPRAIAPPLFFSAKAHVPYRHQAMLSPHPRLACHPWHYLRSRRRTRRTMAAYFSLTSIFRRTIRSSRPRCAPRTVPTPPAMQCARMCGGVLPTRLLFSGGDTEWACGASRPGRFASRRRFTIAMSTTTAAFAWTYWQGSGVPR